MVWDEKNIPFVAHYVKSYFPRILSLRVPIFVFISPILLKKI
jgi:hypothetical protein